MPRQGLVAAYITTLKTIYFKGRRRISKQTHKDGGINYCMQMCI